jgi:hypothetical protein
MSDITVSSDIHTFMQSASNSAARDNLGVGDTDAVNHASLTLTGNATAVEFIGDLEGAVRFNAKAGEALTKGDAVYVSGVSGNLPVVSKADSSNSATMPSFGLAGSTVNLNASVQIITFGTLSSIDTSAFTLGDTLYVNGTGTLSATKPTGESNLIQNIGKVQRVHASAGSIKVGGAGRSNDTPNLNENKIFIGNSSNAASTAAISTVITDNASSVKTSYESNSDTNAYTDAEKTKLSGIATGAEVNAVDSVNAQTGSVTLDADDIDDTSTNHKFATSAQLTKLDGVESGATSDQTGSEIKSAYEGEPNTNAFTDAEKTKLSGIETGATADQDLSSYQLQPSEGAFANGDKTKLDGIEASADVTDATNVNAAGATMNTDTDVSGNSWVLDEDSMSSNDATKVPTQQSVKAYVDANTSSGDATSIQGTNVDSSVGSPSDGDILVYRSAGSDFVLESKPAAGSNPAAADITDATADGIALITSSDANPFTDADESKLDGIAAGAEVNTVDSVNAQTGVVVLDADDISDATTTNKFTTASDISKLAGIEAGATADQTGAEIKAAYESEANTNAFTDAEKTKLAGIAAGAEVNTVDSVNAQTGAVVLDADDISDAATTNKFTTASDISKLAGIEASATADQTGAEIKTAYEGESDTNAFTDAEKTKLSGIETGATADQDLSSYQLQPSEGAFANGDKTKLDGIEASADVTDTANVTSAGALMDSEVTNLAQVKAFDSADYATAAQGTKADSAQQPPSEGAFVNGDKTKLDGIEVSADVTDATNVTAAGALMDSEVTNLAQVKAFDSSDYATAAQGTTADSAQQPPSEGAFVDGDKTKLDGIETGADVTDTANVTAAGALMDSEVDADIKTLSLPASTTISTFGASLVDDADAATARTTLGVDAAGTDNSTNVTLTGSGTYISIAGQAITVDPITESDISDLGTYLTAESDTLDSVTGRGATTTNAITVGSIDINGEIVELAVNTTSVTGSTALDPANGTIQRLTFSGNVTFTDSLANGESITIHIDDGTAYTATWPTMEWVGGSAPTLDTTSETIIVIWKVNSTLYGMSSGVSS